MSSNLGRTVRESLTFVFLKKSDETKIARLGSARLGSSSVQNLALKLKSKLKSESKAITKISNKQNKAFYFRHTFYHLPFRGMKKNWKCIN